MISARAALWTRCTLTCVPELTLAHVLSEHGREALQLGDDSQVKFDVVSPAADAPAEIHLHSARASSDLQRICTSFPRAWARISAVTYRRAEVAPPFLFYIFKNFIEHVCFTNKRQESACGRCPGCPRSACYFCLPLWYIYLKILDLIVFMHIRHYIFKGPESESIYEILATNKPS